MSAGPMPGLGGARLWAAARFPYLASGVFATQVVPAPGSGAVTVDEEWRLHADPDVAAGWSPPSSAACSSTTCATCCARTQNGPTPWASVPRTGPRGRVPPTRRSTTT